MEKKFKQGDRIILEILGPEIYEGTIEYISSNIVELYSIFCQNTNSIYEGNMTFYENEIVKISVISDKLSQNGSLHNNEDENSKIILDPDEFHRLRQMTFDFIFIDSFGKKFNDAIEVLSNRESVGVVGLGSTLARRKGLSLLLMSDFKQIYIFDLYCLVDLDRLRDILESNFICKVIHDGCALNDCLYHKYKVEMNNVFDTKIVDSAISLEKHKKSIERNISQCLTYHFNFPPSLLSAAIDDMIGKIWLERPIIKSNKIKASQLVVYLLTLRDKLMGEILKKYTDSITSEYTKYKTILDSELLKFTK